MLLCSPPGWEDRAGRRAETFRAPATHHIRHFEASEREDDGIGRGGHRQHEGQGGGQGAREHDIERVEADGLSLEGETVGQSWQQFHPRGKGVASSSLASPLSGTTPSPAHTLGMNPQLLPEVLDDLGRAP